MTIYQLIFQRNGNVSVETYKEFEYAVETYEKVVKIWKDKPTECEFVRERYEREFGYFRETEFTNGIKVTLKTDVLRELKNRIKG